MQIIKEMLTRFSQEKILAKGKSREELKDFLKHKPDNFFCPKGNKEFSDFAIFFFEEGWTITSEEYMLEFVNKFNIIKDRRKIMFCLDRLIPSEIAERLPEFFFKLSEMMTSDIEEKTKSFQKDWIEGKVVFPKIAPNEQR